jgi:chromosome segregation and condensation protein ScpB
VLEVVEDEQQLPAGQRGVQAFLERPPAGLRHVERAMVDTTRRDRRRTRGETKITWSAKAPHNRLVERHGNRPRRVGWSRAALEVLAIVAYGQPIARPGIGFIRGFWPAIEH